MWTGPSCLGSRHVPSICSRLLPMACTIGACGGALCRPGLLAGKMGPTCVGTANDAAFVSVRANRMNRRRHQRPLNGQGAIFSNGPDLVCTERGAPLRPNRPNGPVLLV
jgi:hypothetical protein